MSFADALVAARDVTVEVRSISPETAKQWLLLNEGNRKHWPRVVDQYARDMAGGNWKLTGDSIKFNGRRLVDGQHRLMGCVKANVPFVSVVVNGVSDEAHAAIDGGKKRTMADELRWRGVTDPATTAAILALLWRWRNGVLLNPTQPTKAELIRLWDEEEPVLRDSVLAARRLYSATRIPTTSTGAVFAEIAHVDPDVAWKWIDYFARGTGYTDGDSALALRAYAIKVRSHATVRPTQTEWLAATIKAFNAWVDGRPMRIVKWARLGRNKEAFPTLRKDMTA